MTNNIEENYSDGIDYLKKNYPNENLMNNDKILEMFHEEHRIQFCNKVEHFIEQLNKKYIYLYNYSGLFNRDLNNCTWERVYDIIYNNISIDVDTNFIYNHATEIIDILEK